MSDKIEVKDKPDPLFVEEHQSNIDCSNCGNKFFFAIQGFITNDELPEIARVIIACKTCKIQINHSPFWR